MPKGETNMQDYVKPEVEYNEFVMGRSILDVNGGDKSNTLDTDNGNWT
jgi:hypothetical protein